MFEVSNSLKLIKSCNSHSYHSFVIRSNEDSTGPDKSDNDDNNAWTEVDVDQSSHADRETTLRSSSVSTSISNNTWERSIATTFGFEVVSSTSATSEATSIATVPEVSTLNFSPTDQRTSMPSDLKIPEVTTTPTEKTTSSTKTFHLSVIGKPSVWSQPSKMAQLPNRSKAENIDSGAASESICFMLLIIGIVGFLTMIAV